MLSQWGSLLIEQGYRHHAKLERQIKSSFIRGLPNRVSENWQFVCTMPDRAPGRHRWFVVSPARTRIVRVAQHTTQHYASFSRTQN